MASKLEGPLVEAEQIDLVQVHFPQQKPFSTPNQTTFTRHTWVICPKTNCCPTTGRNPNRVPLNRIYQVVLSRVFSRIKVTNPGSNNEKVIAMKMEWILVSCKTSSTVELKAILLTLVPVEVARLAVSGAPVKLKGVGGRKTCVIASRQLWKNREDSVWDAFVLEYSCGSFVVNWDWSIHKSLGGHEVSTSNLVGLDKNVCGLTSINLHYCQTMTGNGKEKLVIQGSIDDSQEVVVHMFENLYEWGEGKMGYQFVA
ncbi:hypothetical protein GmHk_01G002316 [Glycine max]|nr:hypothetical protein GmHk_01G002316 [Glycine max]